MKDIGGNILDLNKKEKIAIDFLMFLYGGSYKISGNLLFINIDKDNFRINLTDNDRFNYFEIYHKSNSKRLDGSSLYHMQCKAYTLIYALWICFTHGFNKEIKIFNSKSDFDRFKKDCEKLLIKT